MRGGEAAGDEGKSWARTSGALASNGLAARFSLSLSLSLSLCISLSRNIGSGGQHCLASWDSDLEALSCNPTAGSVVLLACQLATFAM